MLRQTMDVYESWALPSVVSLMVVVGALAALGAAAILGFVRARHRIALAAAGEASVGEHPPALVEGRDVVLAGVVRHFEHDVAVRVRVHQLGDENESSGSWTHSWTEVDREIILAPFLLEPPSKDTVLVQPPKNVDVADALDRKVWVNRTERILSAELVPGEQIFARGRLVRSDRATPGSAYRDVAWGWALHPTSGGQMLLSSEPLGRGMRQRAQFHNYYGWVALGLLVVTQVMAFPYYARLFGHTEMAEVTSVDTSQWEDDDGDTHTSYSVTVRDKSIDVDGGDWGKLVKGDKIPIRVGGGDNWALGSEAAIGPIHGGVDGGLVAIFWLTYRARRRSTRPWFRRKVNESGSGQLPDPPSS